MSASKGPLVSLRLTVAHMGVSKKMRAGFHMSTPEGAKRV